VDNDLLGFDPTLVDAIIAWAEGHDLPPDLLLAIAYGESGLDAGRSGDDGQSWGAFMAHIPAHGHDPAYWTGVEGARRTMDVMAPRWTAAFARLRGRGRWSSPDPATRVAFFCEYWPAAQGCDPPDPERCRQAVAVGTRLYAEHGAASANGDGLSRDPVSGRLLPAAGPVTQEFGLTDFARAHPELYGPQGHPGIDIGAAAGAAVRAVRAGLVVYAGWRNRAGEAIDDGSGYGITVWVQEPTGALHIYAHLAHAAVAVGDRVRRGALIGAVGSTGRATGPHLHYEVRRDGAAIDPAPYLATGVAISATVAADGDGLHLRAEPRADAESLAVVPDGVAVVLPRDAWYPAIVAGRRGWMWGEFLSFEVSDTD
jgi:hypothetical protein